MVHFASRLGKCAQTSTWAESGFSTEGMRSPVFVHTIGPLLINWLIPVFVSFAADDFPLTGSYMENEPCKIDIPLELRVTITATEMTGPMGHCNILNWKREKDGFAVNVECSGPAENKLVADVRFTPRTNQTIDFSDQ